MHHARFTHEKGKKSRLLDSSFVGKYKSITLSWDSSRIIRILSYKNIKKYVENLELFRKY